MKRAIVWLETAAIVCLLALPWRAGAQQLRSLTTPSSRESDQKHAVPREYMPPPGMCRIWIDNVPPKQQPAPTDCATAVRNKPRNGRVVFSEAARDDDKGGRGKGRDARGKPKKPDADTLG